MIHPWRHTYLYRLGILLIAANLMTGCASFMEGFESNTTPAPASVEDRRFEYALSVYRRGDYAQSASLFSELSTAGTDASHRRRAMLGETCSRLMQADSAEDVAAGRALWIKLKDELSEDAWRAQKVLLDPLIDRLSVPAGKPAPAVAAAPPDKPDEAELTALKKKAEQSAQLQRQLDAVMAENRTLKQKIKALEAIDQNIQKKKTAISAPSE